MRVLRRLVVLLALLAVLGAGGWVFHERQRLPLQWSAYRVGAADSVENAAAMLAELDGAPDAAAQIKELVEKWGTGNAQYDYYLAAYITSPQSSEALRKAFSQEFAWRSELLPRWAYFWCWHAPDANLEMASIATYFDALADSDPQRAITWREVLNLQAVFELTGRRQLAHRLSPAGWHDRYADWAAGRPRVLPPAMRPAQPFNDWKGRAPVNMTR